MYLLEIVKKVSLEQAGMLVAVLKAKVKVRANLSDRIIELSNLTVSVVGCVAIVSCLKHWDEKKNRKFNMLLNEIPCNSRGRSLFARKW
jgi:hypothetical protein